MIAIAYSEGLDEALRSALNRDVVCCCVGPVTAAAARAQGVEDPIFPDRGRLGLMVRCLAHVLHGHHRHLVSGGPDVVLQGCTVRSGARRVTLSRRERSVLDILARRPGAIVSRPLLLREVWAGAGGLHVVDITVGRLRHRLQPLGLGIWATRHGYRLETAASRQFSHVLSCGVGDG